ncbi:hypothetical protein GJ744_011056 [Endocarpon pusillum]|uniref:Alpha/beta hydrolase fold-3 domain-containing protein n=1 Tax=Endocarpon pusillum TaxID=364733 RepID=A0A8H7AD48_9EURO|nr:hypothetical protein GJ744_011056 [Endocarpon pusillum]
MSEPLEQFPTSIQIIEPGDPPSSASASSSPAPALPHWQASSEDPDSKSFRPRSLSHHLHPSHPAPSRWWLRAQATFWRTLMSCSMFLHDWAPPRPPVPAFTRSISTEYDRPRSPPILLFFYVPPDYFTRSRDGHRYPVVINFHGGGFSLGNATDDRYWANVVLQKVDAVVVSVDYRRAPEFPFPTPVDDSVDAVLYLAAHAEELGLDPTKVALSGFSAGANLAFTVPLRLNFHTRKGLMSNEDLNLPRWPSTQKLMESATNLKIVNIVAFYPLLDWSLSRDSKRRTSRKPEKTLPKFFADLFDYSYLPPPDTMLHASPFVSPGLAPDNMLTEGLPHDIQIFLCEWDMLLKEGEIFARRLERLGKNIIATLVPEVVHGWDKHPDPWRDQKAIDAFYAKACDGLRESFGIEGGDKGDKEEDSYDEEKQSGSA